ncbi:Retrotrans gag domain-containing protein [Abeliophyllum distichum]|uniref:Retrotrans gag domain-containing protein n=1 Tax=Abeliophyllum distichum TaxID=126358 RepID=A0ABD1V763_9LAMI
MSASVFKRLDEHGPRNWLQVSHQRREPLQSSPRNRRERRASVGDDQQAQLRIRNASIPYEFSVPKITPYTGKGDPLDHVNAYKTEMSLQGATPVLKCKACNLTLLGGAKRWYNKLVPGSISSWPELKKNVHQLIFLWKTSLRPSATPS